MAADKERVDAIITNMISSEALESMLHAGESKEFAGHLGKLAYDWIFGEIWARPGLDLRSRSLVVLGILIALRASDQLEFHIPAALKHGLTVAELEEVIYQASGYAGMPAAANARAVAVKILGNKPQG